MDIEKAACEGVDWIYLAQDRDWLEAVVSTAGSFGIHEGGGIFLTS
jgi:hypothetical protein